MQSYDDISEVILRENSLDQNLCLVGAQQANENIGQRYILQCEAIYLSFERSQQRQIRIFDPLLATRRSGITNRK
jgi:hypothetical protein